VSKAVYLYMSKAVSNEQFRIHLTELASEVRQTGEAIDVQVSGKPRYQIASSKTVDPERLRTCVRVGPHWLRKNLTEVRGLALFDDIPFGLTIRGEVAVIFQRHPSYRPAIVDEVRGKFASRQGKAPPDLASRVSILEAQVKALVARLDEQSALGSNVPRRPTPYKRPPG
jgi:hypothetical protein